MEDQEVIVQKSKEQIIDALPIYAVKDISYYGWNNINNVIDTVGARFDILSQYADQLVTAVTRPEEFNGVFYIVAGEFRELHEQKEKSIYQVINGNITRDDYNLAPQFRSLFEFVKQREFIPASEGRSVVKAITDYTTILGSLQKDESVLLEDFGYKFTITDDRLSVRSDLTGLEILNSDGYTAYTQSDNKEIMEELSQRVKEATRELQMRKEETEQDLKMKL